MTAFEQLELQVQWTNLENEIKYEENKINELLDEICKLRTSIEIHKMELEDIKKQFA